jgi:hypothetical protein
MIGDGGDESISQIIRAIGIAAFTPRIGREAFKDCP